jgi:hypothetical protein
VDERLASIALKGRERMPGEVFLVTYTLKYNKQNWVTIDSLGEHWAKASVHARLAGGSRVEVETKNVTGLTLAMAPGWSPFALDHPMVIVIDGKEVTAPAPLSDRSWRCALATAGDGWGLADNSATGLRKRHGLQGPIDDAFMDSFLFVRPTGGSGQSAVDAWVKQESEHAIAHWRRQFRGEARVKNDREVTPADIASSNLVLWGTTTSNSVLAQIAGRMPIQWKGDQVQVGEEAFPSEHHALAMIYPNPLNPERYVVLNSGFTYREYDYLNNARQTPKLPDWAIIDVRTPTDSRYPGKIVAADFFGEAWELRPKREAESGR